MFKVVADQLRVSEGLVRCGQCEKVFDANAHLQALPASSPAVSPLEPTPSSISTPSSMPVPALAPVPVSAILGAITPATVSPATPPSAAPAPVIAPPAAPEYSRFDTATLMEPYFGDEVDTLLSPPVPSMMQRQALVHANPSAAEKEVVPPVATAGPRAPSKVSADTSGLSFMGKKRGSSWWDSLLARMGLMCAAVLLALLLVFQVVLRERDRLVAMHPALQPLMTSVCTVLHCQVSAWRQIDAVVMEHSAFTKIAANHYQLSFTLRNAGSVRVALPAVELTLTDVQDQARIRRVFSVQDLAWKQSSLQPSEEVVRTLPLAFDPAHMAASNSFSGYRLLAFYP